MYHNASGNLVKDILGHGLGRFNLYIFTMLFALLLLIANLVRRSKALKTMSKDPTLFLIMFSCLFMAFGIFGLSTLVAGLPVYLFTFFYLFQKRMQPQLFSELTLVIE